MAPGQSLKVVVDSRIRDTAIDGGDRSVFWECGTISETTKNLKSGDGGALLVEFSAFRFWRGYIASSFRACF